MKIFNKFKEYKGVTLTDVVIGMMILIMFTGILTTSFYNIYKNNVIARYDAMVLDYAIKILEGTDKMTYEEVTNDLSNSLNIIYNIPDDYKITLNVENYNKDDNTLSDIIKIVTLNIEYEVYGETKTYSVSKLKYKEI